MTFHPVSRRDVLAGFGGLMAWTQVPRIAHAAPGRDPRFLTVILRGALDGLSAVLPVGDPDYTEARAGLTLAEAGLKGIPLDSLFALNPHMPKLGALYAKGEALIVHAVATPYRERSHFDAQDVLENGHVSPGAIRTGWLNRTIQVMTPGDRVDPRSGFSIGAQVPLVMRGKADVLNWLPPGFKEASPDTQMRLLDIYRHVDPGLAKVLEEGMDFNDMLGGEMQFAQEMKNGMAMGQKGPARLFSVAATLSGKVLSDPNGPRVGAFDLTGWDTHIGEGVVKGRLARLLGGLDTMIDGLHKGLGAAWKDTVVVLVTEFGRTVHMNGTAGTDHGTGTIALVLGGAVKGGRVVTDWPGLSRKALYMERDLMPTTDLRAVLKGLLRDHLDVSEKALATKVFPESADVKPLDGLIA